MTPQTVESPVQGSRQRTRSCATGLVCHRCENSYPLESTVFSCPDCGKGLDIAYDYELAASHFKDFPSSERPQNIWHFEELLPIVDADAQARVGQHSGYTPMIRADRLGAELGIGNLYLKDDSSNRPSLSYKDRVVAISVARLLERGIEPIEPAAGRALLAIEMTSTRRDDVEIVAGVGPWHEEGGGSEASRPEDAHRGGVMSHVGARLSDRER